MVVNNEGLHFFGVFLNGAHFFIGGNFMKLAIVGSRSIKNVDIAPYITPDVGLIISGGAVGVDTIAEQYADRVKMSKFIIRPRYDLQGKRAPLARNEIIVKFCDKVLAFWDGKSRGTKYTIDYARSLNKEVQIVYINQ